MQRTEAAGTPKCGMSARRPGGGGRSQLVGCEGYASLAALVVLTLLGIIGATLAASADLSARRLVRFEAESRMRARLLDGLDEVAEALVADTTPRSDSPGDPVWAVVRSGTRYGDDVELTDISSAVNINTVSDSYLLSDALRPRYDSFSAPEAIRDHLAESGPFRNFAEAEGIVPEEAEGRFFTVYGYWNPFISDVDSLAAMIRARGGKTEKASELAVRLLGAARGNSGFSDRDIALILGEDPDDLAALLTTGPLINVHFADAELLAAVLDFTYAGEKLPNRIGALDALMAGRLMGELSPGDLGAAVEREEGQDDVLRFLGTVTWFWEIVVQNEEMRLTAVAARLPGLTEGARFQVISRRFAPVEG